MKIDRIGDITAFVRVADVRSYTIAAAQLGVSRSAVGKCIVRLEDQLGVRLFHRTTRSISLTDEGEVFRVRSERILADLEEAELLMADRTGEPRGRLRLDLPVSLGRLHVLPVVHAFMKRWPDVVVNVTFTDRYVDLVDEGIDLAIRVGGASDSRLISRNIAQQALVTCATQEYLSIHGVPQTPADLLEQSCLAFTQIGRTTPWRFRAPARKASQSQVESVSLEVHGRFCSSNAEALRDAALSGYGIAQLPTFLIGDDLRSTRLIPVLTNHAIEGAPIRTVYPTSRHLSPRVRQFIDTIVAAWSPCPPWDSR